ncbi:PREDICTED: probable serine/threonine-protein kinase CCRP1 [Amphimedon queenslandica]|uniref:Protein kinase domain-containing protein n=2 Tax=Amphimedon queenslandica TaxID=400682 RepID=A0AAN0JCQ4_AMPQE|nr:PREDICTED: probable serine/threonine-protein kinase CCRP1 [Amphimedon queenslandica]|eukprot:XP_019854557.1 PREDICTED: probable serine/threonine-protein kinase CCRP1 [Amphimedon queenslandica]
MKDKLTDDAKLLLLDIKHENIVQLLNIETDEHNEHDYIILELCLASLSKYFKHYETVSSQFVGLNVVIREILQDAVKGMEYLHKRNVVHRDLKPGNILLVQKSSSSADVKAVLADFGISVTLIDDLNSLTTRTARGTDTWKAPELLLDNRKQRKCGRESDIFAMGCVIYFAETGGNHPFDTGDNADIDQNVKMYKKCDFSLLDDKPKAKDLIEKMIQLDKYSRPTASVVLQDPYFEEDGHVPCEYKKKKQWHTAPTTEIVIQKTEAKTQETVVTQTTSLTLSQSPPNPTGPSTFPDTSQTNIAPIIPTPDGTNTAVTLTPANPDSSNATVTISDYVTTSTITAEEAPQASQVDGDEASKPSKHQNEASSITESGLEEFIDGQVVDEIKTDSDLVYNALNNGVKKSVFLDEIKVATQEKAITFQKLENDIALTKDIKDVYAASQFIKAAKFDAYNSTIETDLVPAPIPPSALFPELSNIQCVSELPDHLVENIEYLLMTATATELRGVLGHLKPLDGQNKIIRAFVNATWIYIGKFGQQVVVVGKSAHGEAEQGGLDAATVTKKIMAINQFKPKYIISIGICFGMDRSTVQLGDVIVSNMIVDLSTMDKEKDKVKARKSQPPAGPSLLSLFGDSSGFQKKHSAEENAKEVKVHCGPVVSSFVSLVDDAEFKEQLKEVRPDALGGEMEGAGIFLAARDAHHKVEAIVIKAVADWGDGRKDECRGWKDFASYAAATYVHHQMNKVVHAGARRP